VTRPLRLLAAVPLLALAVAACSSLLDADEVADGAEEALEETVGSRPDITCPEDLEATVGAETRCVLTAGDDPTEYGVTVTVTSMENGTAKFDVVVDEEPVGGGQ
jgi:hypothetical protein